MSYELALFVDENMTLTLKHEVFADLTTEFANMGGDPDWLVNAVKSAVASSLHGEAVRVAVQSLGGTVLSTEFVGEVVGTTETKADEPEEVAPPSTPVNDDPWGAPTPSENVSNANASGDPWARDSSSSAPKTTQKTQAASKPTESASSGTKIETTRDKYDREFTLGLPDAPNCECGTPAARMKAKAKGSGKWYTKWVCSKGNGADWKNKCSYSEFSN